MTKRPNLTKQEIESIATDREVGMSLPAISAKYNCSQGSVAWHCLRLGADPPKAKPIDTRIRGPLVVQRGDHAVRRFTPEEDKRLIEFERRGLSDTEIGKKLGRRPNSIRGRLMTLARHEERGTR